MFSCPRLVTAFVVAIAAQGSAACRASDLPLPMPRSVERAMWVTRFDFKTAHDVEKIVESTRMAGINTILFQVRGNATALYPSPYEPWAEQFNYTDPGFDPLKVAIDAAHERNMRLVAWVNVVPAWWGKEPPKDPKQLYNKHPEWLWYDQFGNKQALSDKFYVSVNPCLPEVRRYLVEVMRDIVGRYDLDGLHLDYLRFPNEPPAIPAGTKIDYPRDKPTVALFRGETDKLPEEDPKAWNAWRTEAISDILREVRRMVRQTRPSVELSAAVGPDPDVAATHFQDVRTWLAEDLIDVVYPMNYTHDPKVFQERVERWKTIAKGHPVVMGVRVDSGNVALHKEQLSAALQAFRGYSIFAYSSLFDSPNTDIDSQDEKSRMERQARRQALVPMLQSLAKPGAGKVEDS
jgi:uncharacterized lipoprotein YddW (UPF0748 family)